MRKVLVVLVLAIVGVLVAATAAEAKDSLRASSPEQLRGHKVTYTGTTTCTRVVIASRPRGGHRALVTQKKRVASGSFRFVRRVRSSAALGSHSVRVRCLKGRRRLIGKRSLRVVDELAFGGSRPVLPQLLLGLGLLEVGGILIAVGQRPQFPKTRHRTGRGPSGALRKSVHVYAD